MVYGEIAQRIFDILRITPTGNFLNDIVMLILLPSVVLVIFLWFAVNLFLRGHHKKMSALLVLTFYLVIIVKGWYGAFAEFVSNFIILFLIFAGILFFVSRFITKKDLVGGGRESLTKSTGGLIERAQEIRALQHEIRATKRKISELNAQIARWEEKIAGGKGDKIVEEKIKHLESMRDKEEQHLIELESKLEALKRLV